jgi:hypothetical protein
MGLPKTSDELDRVWNGETANLENELLFYDFFRRDEAYAAERPLILCKDGGLMALFSMSGVDPEPLGETELSAISESLCRAIDVFNPANLDAEWRAGAWELQNVFTRAEGKAPLIAAPTRDSRALRYLSESCNEYWQSKAIFHDELLWAVKFCPRFRERNALFWPSWRLREGNDDIALKLAELRAEARFVRRVLHVFEENVTSVTTKRPQMGLGSRWLGEAECLKALWRQVNRRWDDPAPLRRDLPLVAQVASSYRDNTGEHYTIDGQLTRVLTWKVPPERSVAYLFSGLQTDLRFPFSITQTFRTIDFSRVSSRLSRRANFAAALASRHRESALYKSEADDLLGAVRLGKATPFNWYFSAIVQAPTVAELEDRAAKLTSHMKKVRGGDALEERASRVLAELSAIPGNGAYGLRHNVVTSKNVADLAMVYRLSSGDATPFLLFGDRKGGTYSYSLFSRGEPSWNKAVLGLPGSGKSMLMNAFLLGNANFDSQAYVLDKGNSFGPIFELLEREMPSQVAVMRFRGGQFQFNPFPLMWALGERDRRVAAGTYRMTLEGGGELSCPVEDAKLFFEAWLDGLVSQGKALTPSEKNRLDRALKGANGKGGFFRDFENQCRTFMERKSSATVRPPRPLSALLVHLRSEAPEFVPAVELWTRAPRDRFFDSGQDTVSSAKYIYFELTGLEDDPLVAVPFVMALMGSVWKRVQDPSCIHERKAVIIDEAWSFLAHPAFFRVVEDMFRTIRKFNGFITLATQSPRDIKDGNARKLLQSMSEVFLYKGFSEPEFMEQDLHLTQHHRDLHASLRSDDRSREVFYVSQRGLNRVLSVEIPPALYWFATTHAEDKHWRTLFCGQLGLAQGISQLVEACDGRTIAADDLRLQKVSNHARRLGIGVSS